MDLEIESSSFKSVTISMMEVGPLSGHIIENQFTNCQDAVRQFYRPRHLRVMHFPCRKQGAASLEGNPVDFYYVEVKGNVPCPASKRERKEKKNWTSFAYAIF